MEVHILPRKKAGRPFDGWAGLLSLRCYCVSDVVSYWTQMEISFTSHSALPFSKHMGRAMGAYIKRICKWAGIDEHAKSVHSKSAIQIGFREERRGKRDSRGLSSCGLKCVCLASHSRRFHRHTGLHVHCWVIVGPLLGSASVWRRYLSFPSSYHSNPRLYSTHKYFLPPPLHPPIPHPCLFHRSAPLHLYPLSIQNRHPERMMRFKTR